MAPLKVCDIKFAVEAGGKSKDKCPCVSHKHKNPCVIRRGQSRRALPDERLRYVIRWYLGRGRCLQSHTLLTMYEDSAALPIRPKTMMSSVQDGAG